MGIAGRRGLAMGYLILAATIAGVCLALLMLSQQTGGEWRVFL